MASRYACRWVARPSGVRTTSGGVRTSTLRENCSGSLMIHVADDLVASAPRAARSGAELGETRSPRRRRSRPSRRAGGRAAVPGRPLTAPHARSATARGQRPRSRSSSIRGRVRPPRRREPVRTRSACPPVRRHPRSAGGTTGAWRGRRPPTSPSDRGRASPWRPPPPGASCRLRGSHAACRSWRIAYPSRPPRTGRQRGALS